MKPWQKNSKTASVTQVLPPLSYKVMCSSDSGYFDPSSISSLLPFSWSRIAFIFLFSSTSSVTFGDFEHLWRLTYEMHTFISWLITQPLRSLNFPFCFICCVIYWAFLKLAEIIKIFIPCTISLSLNHFCIHSPTLYNCSLAILSSNANVYNWIWTLLPLLKQLWRQ